ncbi:hypothetical protein [Rhodococcus triatomae]|uniref:hypothetical protein n=1 Tax=Rhodococcus triatomae TaxID=300028 RepID=UPI001FE2728D|nr:hypothetical protein [Rhodococcus triatomae]
MPTRADEGRLPRTSTTIWMLEDLEPFPDDPAVGDRCEPTTYWAAPDMLGLPAELWCRVEARIEEVHVDGHRERVAHLGEGFTTMLPDAVEAFPDTAGRTSLTGCLVRDRHLWADYRTRPTGSGRVLERNWLIQHAIRDPTRSPGWFSVSHDGPLRVHHGGSLPPNHAVVWSALSLELIPAGAGETRGAADHGEGDPERGV